MDIFNENAKRKAAALSKNKIKFTFVKQPSRTKSQAAFDITAKFLRNFYVKNDKKNV